ncbi:MAG TPA: hypothetical protein ENH85_11190 [Candidatus Scalindua sp.]|nr:hypothetical protein [Candidatus Scalindua sp.]
MLNKKVLSVFFAIIFFSLVFTNTAFSQSNIPTPLGSTEVWQALKNDLNGSGKWNQISFADGTTLSSVSGGISFDGDITLPGSILASTGTLTLGGTGNTNNENIIFDFETTPNEISISSSTGASIEYNLTSRMADNLAYQFGDSGDAKFVWETAGNDNLQLGLFVGTAADSGYFSITDANDLGIATRSPLATSADPVLRVYSSDATEALDYIEMYHDQTDGVIKVGTGTMSFPDNNVTIGGTETTTTVNGVSKSQTLSTHITGGSQDYTWMSHVHSNTVGPVIAGARSRGSEASPSVVAIDDNLLDLFGLGYDGTDYEMAAAIHLDVDTTPGNNDMGGRITLSTTPDGGVALVERMRVTNAGNIGFGTASPASISHIKASSPGTVGDNPAGQLIIQSPTNDVNTAVVITGYKSDGSGNPDVQLWYLGSSSSGDANILFLNRQTGDVTLQTTSGDIVANVAGGVFRADSNAADTSAIMTLENTGGDFQWFRDDASPEGVITGNINDFCVAAAELFIKTTDASNTGWVEVGGGVASFSSMWYHGVELTTAIGASNTFAQITSFENVGLEDASGNAVGDATTDDDITINLAGSYEIEIGCSFRNASGSNKNLVIVPGVTLATPLTITGATNATPIVMTVVGHGLLNGDMVTQSGVGGNTAANGDFFVSNKANNTYELEDLSNTNIAGNGAYTSGGTVDIKYSGEIVIERVVSGTDLGRGMAEGSMELAVGDIVELYVANESDANNFILSQLTMKVQREE